jgi:lysyl-tRNA synthetase class 2
MNNININDERDVRLHKLQDLTAAGMPAFPATAYRTHTIALALQAPHESTVRITGRIMKKREIGKLTFVSVQDASGSMQVVFKKDDMDADAYTLFVKKADIGDIIEVSGVRMQTKNGEESVLATEWVMLTKALLPLPDKFHGLQDEELRLRKRYLDILTNDDLRDLFVKKAKFWDVTRQFMKQKGFFEVQTPILETTTGGAEAAPFKTYHNDFDLDVYLRISVGELWQKRLMAAGFEQTFEIGPVFRNEGSSPDHLQEFTNMEFYWAYANYRDGMKLTQELYRTIATEVFGTTTFEHKGMTFDLADEWHEIEYVEEVKKQTGIDVLTATESEMRAKLDELGVTYEGDNRERLMDTLWKYCRKHIAGPAFLIHHPKLVSPLSKSTSNNPDLTERFQIILAGSEVGNGFSELNDPIDQRERFEVQAALIERGDDEAMMPDWEFVEMLEHGMPPTCGFGFGERLFTFMVGKPIREATLFPLMKPEHHHVADKKKKTPVSHIILASNFDALWKELNTVAHLGAAFGARTGKTLFHTSVAHTSDGVEIPMNTTHAIIMKRMAAEGSLHTLIRDAVAQGFHVEVFTKDMIDSSDDAVVLRQLTQTAYPDIQIFGVLIHGERKVVEALTKSYDLL